jgi:hypothetical protein
VITDPSTPKNWLRSLEAVASLGGVWGTAQFFDALEAILFGGESKNLSAWETTAF